MRDDDLLDPELARLYDADRAAPLPEGASARVLASVLAGITTGAAAGAGAATAASAAGGVSTKAVVAIAVASAIGGGVAGVVGYRQLATPAAPVRQPAPPPEPAPPPDPVEPGVDAAAPEPAAPALPPDAARPRSRRDAAPADPDTREPLLVDRARTALRRGLVDDALAALMRHERLHPAGALAEERDVLIIEAYVAKGDPRLARRRIERYRNEHPNGFLRARVDRVEAALDP